MGDPFMAATGFGELKVFSGSAHPELTREIGAFLGVAYFDLYYALITVVVLSKVVLISEKSARKAGLAAVPAASVLAPRSALTRWTG